MSELFDLKTIFASILKPALQRTRAKELLPIQLNDTCNQVIHGTELYSGQQRVLKQGNSYTAVRDSYSHIQTLPTPSLVNSTGDVYSIN
ncbi:hypothetical protein [Pseudomonas fluorescens]|uniref:hypothetical protein n=1 Tax=Pseudomonas fluorescens TaxID=294 RepID=UPI001FCE87C4|nr:hypothetical protein [Pseudomonas fluorescens]